MQTDRTEDGLRAAIAIRAARPSTAVVVVVLSQYAHRRYARGLLDEQPAGSATCSTAGGRRGGVLP
jgi:hypothetical protein